MDAVYVSRFMTHCVSTSLSMLFTSVSVVLRSKILRKCPYYLLIQMHLNVLAASELRRCFGVKYASIEQ